MELSDSCGGELSAISEDGSTVVYLELCHVFVAAVSSNGTNLRTLVGSLIAEQGGPSASGDGQVVVFDADVIETLPPPHGGYQSNIHIFRVLSDGTGLTQLTTDTSKKEVRPRISADGATILYQGAPRNGRPCQTCGWQADLFAMDGDGANERRLTSGMHVGFCGEGCDTSALSADGSTGVMSTQEGGVLVVGTDGTGLRQLSYGGRSTATNVEVTIDGTSGVVVHTRFTPSGIPEVVAVGVPGHVPPEMEALSFGDDGRTLSWLSSPLANVHNLYRGDIQDLRSGSFGACLQGGIAASNLAVADAPTPGSGWFYLVTGENATDEGSAGFTTSGAPRLPALSCPPSDTDGDGTVDRQDTCLLFPDASQADTDGDRVGDVCDSCPAAYNPDQVDRDADKVGDPCDHPDLDLDGVPNYADNCPTVANPTQADRDEDWIGDACDDDRKDRDGDGVVDSLDNCTAVANPGQEDIDRDQIGDACDPEDYDADGVLNFQDNCPIVANPSQTESDGDGIGDACDPV